MAWKDLYNNLTVVHLMKPDAVTSDMSTTMVDLQGYNSALFVISVGCMRDNTAVHTITLQESDTRVNGDFSNAATADTLGTHPVVATIGNVGTDNSFKLGYIGNKRYIRLSVDEENVTEGGMSIIALLGAARHAPATTDAIAGTTLTS